MMYYVSKKGGYTLVTTHSPNPQPISLSLKQGGCYHPLVSKSGPHWGRVEKGGGET